MSLNFCSNFDYFDDFDVNEPIKRPFDLRNNVLTRMGVSIEETSNCFGKVSNMDIPVDTDYSIFGTTSHYKSSLGEKCHYTTSEGQEVIVKKGKDYQKALWRANKSEPWKLLGYNGCGLSFGDPKIYNSLPEHIDLTSGNAKIRFPYTSLDIMPEFKGFETLKGLTKNQCSMLKNTIKGLLRFI